MWHSENMARFLMDNGADGFQGSFFFLKCVIPCMDYVKGNWKQFQVVKFILFLSLPTFCEYNGHVTRGEYKEGRSRRKCKVLEGAVEGVDLLEFLLLASA